MFIKLYNINRKNEKKNIIKYTNLTKKIHNLTKHKKKFILVKQKMAKYIIKHIF